MKLKYSIEFISNLLSQNSLEFQYLKDFYNFPELVVTINFKSFIKPENLFYV